MYAILNLFNTILSIYIWLLIASAALLSWLIAFNVVNTGNRFVYQLRGTSSTASPSRCCGPNRNLLPDLGGIDISPIVPDPGTLFHPRSGIRNPALVAPASPAVCRAAGLELAVKVTPRAGRSMIAGIAVDAAGSAWLAVKVTADGKIRPRYRGLIGAAGPSGSACRHRRAASLPVSASR